MAITLTRNSTTVALPAMTWEDRDSWSPVVQSVQTSITGAALVDVSTKTAGREITLVGDANHAWMSYATVEQLKAWASVPGAQMLLTIDGTEYTVLFRHHNAPAIDLTPVVDYDAPVSVDWYFGTLKFMEV